MLVFSVYIPFLISRVRPEHSIFERKSILENPSQIFTNLFFYAYLFIERCRIYTLVSEFLELGNNAWSVFLVSYSEPV